MTSVALALRTVMFTANEGECVDIFLRKMRLQPANINSLVNIAFLDPDSTVRKHFCNWEWTGFRCIQFSLDIGYGHVNLATNLVVIIDSLFILA